MKSSSNVGKERAYFLITLPDNRSNSFKSGANRSDEFKGNFHV